MTTAGVFWIAALIAFGVIEAATATLVSVWFCGGAAAALIAAALGAKTLTQVIVFVVVSAILLACLRPAARRLSAVKKEPTNADRILGTQAVVTEAIDPLAGTGAVRVGGVEWTAKADTAIPKGAVVTIRRIEGVKVCVEPEPETAEIS